MDSRLIFRPSVIQIFETTEICTQRVLLDLHLCSEGFQWSTRSSGFDRDNADEQSSQKNFKGVNWIADSYRKTETGGRV